MRICVASIHPRALSGQVESLVGLTKELRRLGHDVEIVSAFGEELFGQDRLMLGERDRGFVIGKLSRISKIVVELISRSKRADVIHLNLPTPAFSLLGDILQWRVAAPVVVGFEAHLATTSGVVQLPDLLSSPGFYIPRLLLNNRLFSKLTLRNAARYIVSSAHQAAELRCLGFPLHRVNILPNVIDVEKVRRLDRVDARRSLDLPDGRLVAYVGHYNHVKGADLLAEAFSHVAHRFDDAWLILAWSGIGDAVRVRRALSNAGVQDRALELGFVPVATLLSAVDVLVLPYRYTIGQCAFPGVLLEAMAVGVPLVTSDLPLVRELVQHEESGLLVPPGEPSALAWAIARLLSERELASEMIARQRQRFAELLDPRSLIRRYERLYADVLKEWACSRQRVLLVNKKDV